MASSRNSNGGSFYGVVELDANLKNTIQSLETATSELKKLAALDLDYKMPGLSAFRTDTERMISMLHAVCNKVEDALNERRNESQIIMNAEQPLAGSTTSSSIVNFSASNNSDGKASKGNFTSSGKTLAPAASSKPPATVVYDFEIKLKLTK